MGVPEGMGSGLGTPFIKFTIVTIPARRIANSKKLSVY
jgi:hypothetical protein